MIGHGDKVGLAKKADTEVAKGHHAASDQSCLTVSIGNEGPELSGGRSRRPYCCGCGRLAVWDAGPAIVSMVRKAP